MFFLIAVMSRRLNVFGNEGWAKCGGTGPSLFRSTLTHNKWFCLALSLCWHCQVLMPIRLLSTSGHQDDMRRTMPVSLSNYHLHTSLKWLSIAWVERCTGFVVLHYSVAISQDEILVLFIKSLAYLTHFFIQVEGIFPSHASIIGVQVMPCHAQGEIWWICFFSESSSLCGRSCAGPCGNKIPPASNEERNRL